MHKNGGLPSIDLRQYAAALDSDDDAYATLNTDVINGVCDLLERPELRWSSAADVLKHPITFMPDSAIALSRNYTEEFNTFVPALNDVVSHGETHPDWHQFVDMLEDPSYAASIKPFFDDNKSFLATDTFNIPGLNPVEGFGYAQNGRRYCWTHSPVADVRGDFDQYMGLLASRRRSKIKRAMARWTGPEYTIEHRAMTDHELLSWAIPHLAQRRRYDGFGHALRQLLFGLEAARYGVGDMFLMFEGRELLACWYYIDAPFGVKVYQGMVKCEDRPTDYLGQASLAFAIQHYCGNPMATYVDPTCITQPFEAGDSIDVYKRSVITTSAWRPVFMAAFDPEVIKTAHAPFFNGQTGEFSYPEDPFAFTPNRFEDL